MRNRQAYDLLDLYFQSLRLVPPFLPGIQKLDGRELKWFHDHVQGEILPLSR